MRSIAKDGHMFLSIACSHARLRSWITWRKYLAQFVITAYGDGLGALGYRASLFLTTGKEEKLEEVRKP